MFDVKVEVRNTLFTAFKTAVKNTYHYDTVEKKIADIKIGSPVFNDGLTFVVEKSNGKIKFADGTEYDFLTAIRKKLFTV